ncbi:hypothetical protein GWK47_041297 [Chionoecetes opilio]|uniref:Uncharacterized protein n=1 Tax=Chionoecetes opilio TaxID=41210 RepID=A0A8J4YCK5_CHIOP|nr:hypothetical protein GWK47_041297 [Chionoecetes opilio]
MAEGISEKSTLEWYRRKAQPRYKRVFYDGGYRGDLLFRAGQVAGVSMACSTRKSRENCSSLINHWKNSPGRQLPTGEEVLRRLYSFDVTQRHRGAVVTELWSVGKARSQTMEIRSSKSVGIRSEEYEKLKINRRGVRTLTSKGSPFKERAQSPFDISHKDALSSMKNKRPKPS